MIEQYAPIGVKLVVILVVITVVAKLLTTHSDFIKEIGTTIVDELSESENEHKSKAMGFLLCLFGMFIVAFAIITWETIIGIINIVLEEENNFGSPTSLFLFCSFSIFGFAVLVSRHVEKTSDPLTEKQKAILEQADIPEE